MSDARQLHRWTLDEYLAWEARQPVRHELVDGHVHAMVGGTRAHDTICNRLRFQLFVALQGKPCQPQGPDLKVRAGESVRYPDALIDCGKTASDSLFAQEPVAVFEVLSRSTAWIDQTLKLRDYAATSSVLYYVLINQDEPRVVVYRRGRDGRLGVENAVLLEGMDAAIALAELDVAIPLSALYEGLVLPPV